MGNNAITTNNPVFRNADLAITRRGSSWYFAVCAVMGVSTLAVLGLSFKRRPYARTFHYISAGLLATATIAYFSMGAGLGQVPITVEFTRGGEVSPAGTREIFYVRYIDWFVTTPLLLLDLLLTAGLSWPTIISAIFADIIMVVCGLVGALTQTRYKWGYFVFGCVAFFYVAYVLLIEGRKSANGYGTSNYASGNAIKRTYNMCAVYLFFIWMLYPIAWGLSEGGNVIHPDSEAVFYGILDLLAKPVFTALLLMGHKKIDVFDLGFRAREHGGLREHDPLREKRVGAHVGDHAGTHTDTNPITTGTNNGTHNGTRGTGLSEPSHV